MAESQPRIFIERLVHRLVMLLMLTLTTGCISFHNLPFNRSDDGQPFSAAMEMGKSQLAFRYIPREFRTDEKVIGVISFEQRRGKQTQTVFEIRKIPKGYAAEAPLFEKQYTKQKKMQANFSISIDKEHDLMAGFKLRWQF